MINITRGKRPNSLDNPDIKTYLEEVISYNNLSEEDRKNTPQPKGGISYRNSDVLEAFERDFYSKCYLTEQKYQTTYSMDIEHFRSKAFGQFPELKYEWTNLYPCSHDANMSKPRIEPKEGYLDSCNSNDDVEREIIYTLEMGGVAFFDVLNLNNIKAINTCKLLDKIHNGTDEYSRKKTAELRFLISKKEREVIDLIMEWLYEKDNEDKVRVSRKIKNILSRKSDFTMLLRSLSSVRKYVPEDFLD
jgi:hypothetical protein